LVLLLQLLQVRQRTLGPAHWHGRRTFGRDRL